MVMSPEQIYRGGPNHHLVRRSREWSAWLPDNGAYSLLPFKFHVLNQDREVLVSETGDFLLCPRGTADRRQPAR